MDQKASGRGKEGELISAKKGVPSDQWDARIISQLPRFFYSRKKEEGPRAFGSFCSILGRKKKKRREASAFSVSVGKKGEPTWEKPLLKLGFFWPAKRTLVQRALRGMENGGPVPG